MAEPVNEMCHFFRLPLELREEIYHLSLSSSETTRLGTSLPTPGHLHPFPRLPALLQTCSLIRIEALPIYYATHYFTLQMQSRPGIARILEWIRHCSSAYPQAFGRLRYITLETGLGFYAFPQRVTLDLKEGKRLDCKPPHLGHGTISNQLKDALDVLQQSRNGDVDIAQWLEGVVRSTGVCSWMTGVESWKIKLVELVSFPRF
jgi:hypothetical protein